MTVFNVGGWAVDSVEGPKFTALATATAVPSTAVFRGGAAFTHSGRRYCEIISGAVPATAVKLGGVAHRQDGAVYVTNALPSAIYYRGPRNLPCNADGAVYVNPTAAISQRRAGYPFASDGGLISRTGDIGLVWELDAEEAESLVNCCTVAPTVTRATTKTRANSSGLIESVAAATILRDYDPVTLAVKGFLIEEQRTNLLLHSNDFSNAAWVSTATPTVTQNATGADGTTSAWTITDDDAANNEGKHQDVVVANDSVTRVYSIFVKKTSGATVFPGIIMQYLGGTPIQHQAVLNTNTGAGTASGGTLSFENWGDRWRVSLSLANNTTGNTTLRVGFRAAVSTNSAASTFDVAQTGSAVFERAQLEAGSFPTSYIPTTTASVTRNFDLAALLTSAIPGFSSSVSTVCIEGHSGRVTAAAIASYIGGAVGTDQFDIRISGANATLLINSGGVNQASVAVGPWAVNTFAKVAATCAANDFAGSVNGAAVVSDAAGVVPASMANFYIGGQGNGGAQFNGWLKKLRVYNRRLSNAELQAMTA